MQLARSYPDHTLPQKNCDTAVRDRADISWQKEDCNEAKKPDIIRMQ